MLNIQSYSLKIGIKKQIAFFLFHQ